jgi:nicotinate-nucleotide adenylyltransferase
MTTFAGIRRLGVMGGTFDPPHIGHLQAASAAADAVHLDRVLFVPAARPWQKSEYSHPEDRFAMTVLAAATDPRFVASRIELDRNGPTYTLDTMTTLSTMRGSSAELFFILGADAALNLRTWHGLEELSQLMTVIAVTRPGFDLAGFDHPEGFRVDVVEISPVEVSSTQIRAAVAEGRSIDGLVPVEVAAYIAERGLYRGPGHNAQRH